MTVRHRTRTALTAFVALAIVAVAVAPAHAESASQAPRVHAVKELPTIDKSRSMSTSDRAAIDAEAAAFLAGSLDQAPGLWLAVWDPKRGYYEQAYGQAVVGGATASTRDHFLIGSVTKTVFATAVLEQVAQGRLSLTDTVRKLDPALAKKYPRAAGKTVAQLLGMTSRIPDYADAAVMKMFANPRQTFTRDQLIALGFAEGKAIAAPGGYSTTNYILLGKLMQTLTGKTPESLVNRVFRQAGMDSSRLMAGSVKVPSPRAHGYVGAVAAQQAGSVSTSLTTETDVTDWTMQWGKEGGGATSTIGDLATWGSTCLGDSLLPAAIVSERLTTTPIDAGNYGLGIIRQGNWLAHSGQAIGYTTNVACNPATGAVIAYAVNSTYGSADLSSYVGAASWPAYARATTSRS